MNYLIEYFGNYYSFDLELLTPRVVEINKDKVRLTARRIEEKPTVEKTGWGFVLVEYEVYGKWKEYSNNPTNIAKLRPSEHRMNIGMKISSIRQSKGLSVRQLSEICGVSSQNITKIEHGRYNVSMDILGKICDALDCRIDIVEKIKI